MAVSNIWEVVSGMWGVLLIILLGAIIITAVMSVIILAIVLIKYMIYAIGGKDDPRGN